VENPLSEHKDPKNIKEIVKWKGRSKRKEGDKGWRDVSRE